jgi:NAD(P)H-hydrate epimerase
MKLYYADNLKNIDSKTYSTFGYSEAVLMENAGSNSYKKLLDIYGENCFKNNIITVICGKGNNGGDGFVIARYLFNAGYNVKTVILSDARLYKGIALSNLKILTKLKSAIIEISKEEDINLLSKILSKTTILIDAVFGIGLNKEISGLYKKVIDLINNKDNYNVICIDVPSGLNSDNGLFMGTGIKKNIKAVFTYGGLKPGFYLNDGEKLNLYNKIVLIDINHPKSLLEKYHSSIELLTEEAGARFLPLRKLSYTKFDYGHLLIIAGSPGKSGAAYMSSLAGLKSGAGLVTLAVPSAINTIMEIKTTEVMTYPVADKEKGVFNTDSVKDIADNILKGKKAVVIGPGIGLKDETADFLYKLVEKIEVPIVIDADGLNLLSKNMEVLKKLKEKKADIILTPHYKEMERLTGIDIKIIEKEPLKIAEEFVKKYGVYLILKDSSMFIFHKNGELKAIQSEHSPLLASGGSGDVLSGLIGSFIVQGVDIYSSLLLSAFLLVYTANNLRLRLGDTGAGASEIALNLPVAIKLLKEKYNSITI